MKQWTLTGAMELVFERLPEDQRLLALWAAGIAETATVQREVPEFASAFRGAFEELAAKRRGAEEPS